ncbi:hypothetical protein PAMP_001203 [Pampus punctatissimus]
MSRGGNRTDKGDSKLDLCGRGSWWLETLKDTPIPGFYHIRDFIEEAELNPVRKTYGFKGSGRKAQILGVRKGDVLLPGAYQYTDATQEILKHQASYSFKNCPRPDIITLGIRDKHINTSPCDYNVTVKQVEKIPCNHPPLSSPLSLQACDVSVDCATDQLSASPVKYTCISTSGSIMQVFVGQQASCRGSSELATGIKWHVMVAANTPGSRREEKTPSCLPLRRDLLHVTTIHRPDQQKASLPALNPHCRGSTMCTHDEQLFCLWSRHQAPSNLCLSTPGSYPPFSSQ